MHEPRHGPPGPARAALAAEAEGAALAESVRAACIRAALDAYEDAGMQGLCAEGRWELAVQAMRRVELP